MKKKYRYRPGKKTSVIRHKKIPKPNLYGFVVGVPQCLYDQIDEAIIEIFTEDIGYEDLSKQKLLPPPTINSSKLL